MAKNKVKLSPEARRKALRRLLRYSRPLIPIAAGAFVLAGISIVAAHFIPVLVGMPSTLPWERATSILAGYSVF